MDRPDAAALLEHAAWLKRFAAALASDGPSADDLVQDALGAAITTRRPIRDLRSFLAGTLKWRSSEVRREEGRRRKRESDHAASRGWSVPGADQAAARVELMRLVLTELEALLRAQRDAVTMRYVDGVASEEIARRAGVTVATVRGHLSRGLATLRERLDRRAGDRANWLAAFAPWSLEFTSRSSAAVSTASSAQVATVATAVPLHVTGAALSSGVLLMSTKLIALALAPIAVIGIWVGFNRAPDDLVERAAQREIETPGEDVSLASVDGNDGARLGRDAGVGAVGPASTVGPGSTAGAGDLAPLKGRAVDSLTGEPVPSIHLFFREVGAIPPGHPSSDAPAPPGLDSPGSTALDESLSPHFAERVRAETDSSGEFASDEELRVGGGDRSLARPRYRAPRHSVTDTPCRIPVRRCDSSTGRPDHSTHLGRSACRSVGSAVCPDCRRSGHGVAEADGQGARGAGAVRSVPVRRDADGGRRAMAGRAEGLRGALPGPRVDQSEVRDRTTAGRDRLFLTGGDRVHREVRGRNARADWPDRGHARGL